jgi:AbrB family looped-hinge helix DNA binding protein
MGTLYGLGGCGAEAFRLTIGKDMPLATLTSKGQVTIPAVVRERLGLRTGDRVDFSVAADGSVTLKPQRMPFEKLRGLLRGSSPRRPVSVSEMDEGIRQAVTARWKRASGRPGR